ncbi:MAG TPA: carboxypeptidase-like regulatory domain-containing protein [Terriglobales bacterium]|nr:carboxypeptidase-like regulatory domain-containing protein [Terriglobales bacterium]
MATTRSCPSWPLSFLRNASLRARFAVIVPVFAVWGCSVWFPITPARADSRNGNYALIFGTVWDPNGRPVYGVKIKIRRSNQRKPKWELYSDHNGEFAQRVPPGRADYLISADLKGFKSADGTKFQAGPEITAHVENDERVDIGLHLTK